MKICWNCKHTFEPEEIRWATEPHGERIACCPNCGDIDIEEAHYCKICGKPFCEDDLYYGICDECRNEKIRYDTFREFALDGAKERDCSLLEEFLYEYEFNFSYSDVPSESHAELRKLLVGYYDKMVADIEYNNRRILDYEDKLLMPMIKQYLKDYAYEWFDWLNTKIDKGEVI